LEEETEEFETGRITAVRLGIEGLLILSFDRSFLAGEIGSFEGRFVDGGIASGVNGPHR